MPAKMNRRDMLRLFTSGVVGAMVLDPEKLLWVPGEKTIFLPAATATAYTLPESALALWTLAVRVIEHPMGAQYGYGYATEWIEIDRTEKTILYAERRRGGDETES
jgi:hypothetical protein